MENKRYNLKNAIRDYFYIFLGTIIASLGLVFFLIPNKIATGGVAGLSTVLHYIIHWPTGIIMLTINIPLLLIGVKQLGKTFALRSLVTFIGLSFFTDFFIQTLQFKALTSNTLLATLYGGVLIGVGLGFIFKADSSAGGGTLLAKVISSKTQFKTGQILFVMDVMVISTAGLAFKNVELALWGFLTIFISSQLIDVILTGKPYAKVVQIVTNEVEPIGEHIISDLGKTATIINSTGLYSDQGNHLMLVVIETSKIYRLRDIVKFHDPDAFMIITDAREILGKGF